MVDLYKLKLTLLQQKILRVLFIKNGMILNQRQIAKYLDVSQTAVMKALPSMKKQEAILAEKDRETKRMLIRANLNDYKISQLKRVDNLKLIYESGLADFLEKNLPGATITLFGSYSRGDDTVKSDIDIAVIGRKEKKLDLEHFEAIHERKIMINFYDSFKNIHKNLKENLFNGIVLYGAVEL